MNNDNAVEHTTRAPWHRLEENKAKHAALEGAGWTMKSGGLYYATPGDKPVYWSPPGAYSFMTRSE